MTLVKTIISGILLGAQGVWANNPIPESAFTDGQGFAAALAAAPMWYMPSGTCMPSAAEDGHGHQTNGVAADNCNIGKLNHGCPPEPAWKGIQTHYGNIPGEPFATIPTYFRVQKCPQDSSGNDGAWRIVYYVYFKKDTGHMSDWEGVVVRFVKGSGGWVRESAIMEQDGKHPHIAWGDINDTFDGVNDWAAFGQKNRDHAKFYFSKFHHSVHHDWHTSSFKDTCNPTRPNSDSAYRNPDYQWWSRDFLRHTDNLHKDWTWGEADPPNSMNICAF